MLFPLASLAWTTVHTGMLKSIETKRFSKKDRNLSLERMLTFIQHTEILKLQGTKYG